MVFKSKEELIVIGKCVNDNIVRLTDKDIEMCKAYSFIYQYPEEDEIKEEKNEDVEDEVDEESEIVSTKMAHKITAIPMNLNKKIIDSTKAVKKSISSNINKEDVDIILQKIQSGMMNEDSDDSDDSDDSGMSNDSFFKQNEE